MAGTQSDQTRHPTLWGASVTLDQAMWIGGAVDLLQAANVRFFDADEDGHDRDGRIYMEPPVASLFLYCLLFSLLSAVAYTIGGPA